jgi:HK97 family phage prohead protease
MSTVRGYACVFNALSKPLLDCGETHFREIIKPGAFRLGRAVVASTHHHARTGFATTLDGTLRLWQDEYGLAFEAAVPRGAIGDGVNYTVGSGAACSFGLIARAIEWRDGEDMSVRIVHRCEIDHVSICPAGGAYPGGAWLASWENSLPPRYAELARKWHGRGSAIAALTARQKQGMPLFPPSLIARLARAAGRPA